MRQLNRMFRLWDYSVSHDQLLLRSPKTETEPRNLDIVFVGVKYLDLPTHVPNPTMLSPDEADFRKAQEALGKLGSESELFIFQIGDRRHLIVAVAMKLFENDLDIFESSLERFD